MAALSVRAPEGEAIFQSQLMVLENSSSDRRMIETAIEKMSKTLNKLSETGSFDPGMDWILAVKERFFKILDSKLYASAKFKITCLYVEMCGSFTIENAPRIIPIIERAHREFRTSGDNPMFMFLYTALAYYNLAQPRWDEVIRYGRKFLKLEERSEKKYENLRLMAYEIMVFSYIVSDKPDNLILALQYYDILRVHPTWSTTHPEYHNALAKLLESITPIDYHFLLVVLGVQLEIHASNLSEWETVMKRFATFTRLSGITRLIEAAISSKFYDAELLIDAGLRSILECYKPQKEHYDKASRYYNIACDITGLSLPSSGELLRMLIEAQNESLCRYTDKFLVSDKLITQKHLALLNVFLFNLFKQTDPTRALIYGNQALMMEKELPAEFMKLLLQDILRIKVASDNSFDVIFLAQRLYHITEKDIDKIYVLDIILGQYYKFGNENEAKQVYTQIRDLLETHKVKNPPCYTIFYFHRLIKLKSGDELRKIIDRLTQMLEESRYNPSQINSLIETATNKLTSIPRAKRVISD